MIALSTIELAEDCAVGLLGRSTRIRLCVCRPGATKELGIIRLDVGLGFDREGLGLENGRKVAFLEALQKALQRKSWEAIEAKAREELRTREIIKGNAASASGLIVTSTSAGVGGIIRNQQSTLREADSLARQAALDMDALMERAKEAVSMVERFAKYIAESEAQAPGSGSSSSVASENEIEDMEAILHSIGIVSPVTRFSAGRSYHEQLARQVSEVLLNQDRLQRMGNMITLTDLYCLYNRARGTELVSPDDLKAAVSLMGSLGLGMRMVRFPSGVLVVQSQQLSEESVCNRLLALFASANHVNRNVEGFQSTVVARLLKLPLVVAKEQLLLAEARGVLCRDESSYGVAFFENKFI